MNGKWWSTKLRFRLCLVSLKSGLPGANTHSSWVRSGKANDHGPSVHKLSVMSLLFVLCVKFSRYEGDRRVKLHESIPKLRSCNAQHEGILPKGPYPPCLPMADRAILAGYPRTVVRGDTFASRHNTSNIIHYCIQYNKRNGRLWSHIRHPHLIFFSISGYDIPMLSNSRI